MAFLSRLSLAMKCLLGTSLLIISAGQALSQVTIPAPYDTVHALVRSIGIGPQIGYFNSSGASGGALYFGVAGRFRFANIFAAEASLGYRGKQTFDFVKVQGNDLSAQTSSIPITLSLMMYIAVSQSYIPYLLGGVSLNLVTVDYSPAVNVFLGDETKLRGGAHLGLGVEFPLSQYLSANLDYRYLFLGDIFSGGGGYDFSGTKYSGSMITGGLFFYF